MKKAIFLDRDGTVNIEKEYLFKKEDFEFEKGSLEAIKIFKELGYIVLIVTNQSGIARGYYTEEDLKKLNNYMIEQVEKSGGKIEHCYYCPHHAEKGVGIYKVDCLCRKPNAGMLLQGIEEYGVDLSKSFMVGDKLSDLEAGECAGLTSILVRTGYGLKTEKKINEKWETFDNLYEFAKFIQFKEKN